MSLQSDMAIITVTHNRCEEVLMCIGSIEKSTYQRYTIICVDNASTDGSVKRIMYSYPRVKLIENKSNLGPSVGRNQGIKYAMSRGYKYLVFLLYNMKGI